MQIQQLLGCNRPLYRLDRGPFARVIVNIQAAGRFVRGQSERLVRGRLGWPVVRQTVIYLAFICSEGEESFWKKKQTFIQERKMGELEFLIKKANKMNYLLVSWWCSAWPSMS